MQAVWRVVLSWMQFSFPSTDKEESTKQHGCHGLKPEATMAGASPLYLLLLLPLCTLQSVGQIIPHEVKAAPPPPAQSRHLSNHDENQNTKLTGNQVDSAKVGLFIAASIGIFALMAAVYCIYTRFYTKHQYLHAQLNEDPDFPSDPCTDPPPVFFHGSTFSSAADVRKGGYGSLSVSSSIISVPPSLSPPPCAMPFPPPFLSSHSLRTISARDLQKSCI